MDQGTCRLTASGHDRSLGGRLVASLSRLRSCAAGTGASDHPAGKHAVALKYILSRHDSSHVSVGDGRRPEARPTRFVRWRTDLGSTLGHT